ncbi:MAG: HD domain-containing phosphohydrolase [Planctomycetota bacterium]
MMKVKKTQRVRVMDLIAGSTLKTSLVDDTGQVLLRPNVEITETFRDSLITRGIDEVEIQAAPPAGVKPKVRPDSRTSSVKSQRISRGRQLYDIDRGKRFARSLTDATSCIGRLGQQLTHFDPTASGRDGLDTTAVVALPEVLLKNLLEDSEQMIATTTDYQTEADFAQRCSRLCVLSMETGVELGFTEMEIHTIGTAALLHDIGLFSAPLPFRDSSAILSSDQSWEYRKHPRVAERILREYTEFGDEICKIVSQVHERRDGSGYPDCLSMARIHPFALIIGTIDAFLTLTTSGPGRPALAPHDAVSFLLIESMRGTLDAEIVEALVNNLSLYPINSRVELVDGRQATVLRRNDEEVAYPFVQVDGEPGEELVSTRERENMIKSPIVDLERGQMPMKPTVLNDITWPMVETHPGLGG